MAFGRIKVKLIKIYDSITEKKATISIGDIVNIRTEIENNQFLLITRLLDIEDYKVKGISSFNWQNTISRKAYGNEHREQDGNRAFEELIKSYSKKGYDPSSYFVVDRDLCLLDGNHRMGMNLYMGIDTINVRVLKRKSRSLKSIDWYLSAGLDTSFIEAVNNRLIEIQNVMVDTGNVFCAIVSDKIIAKDLSFLVIIKKMNDFSEIPHNTVWGSYSLPSQGLFLRFTLNDPQYYIKNGNAYSKRIEEIRKVIGKRTADSFVISRNCLEGKQLYELIRPYLKKDD